MLDLLYFMSIPSFYRCMPIFLKDSVAYYTQFCFISTRYCQLVWVYLVVGSFLLHKISKILLVTVKITLGRLLT